MKAHLLFLLAALIPVATSEANTILSVQFGGAGNTAGFTAFTGVEPDAAVADANFLNSNQWNYVLRTFAGGGTFTTFPLLTSTSAQSGIQFSTTADGGENLGGNLPATDIYINDPRHSPNNFSITGLAPNANFVLYLYGQLYSHNGNNYSSNVQVGSASFSSATAHISTEFPDLGRDGFITGVTTSSGSILGTWGQGAANQQILTWSGFQLDVASTPEPATYLLLGGGILLLGLLRAKLHTNAARRSTAALPQPLAQCVCTGVAGTGV